MIFFSAQCGRRSHQDRKVFSQKYHDAPLAATIRHGGLRERCNRLAASLLYRLSNSRRLFDCRREIPTSLLLRSLTRSVSRFTPIYMALIDPFRKLVVYPSLLRTVRAKWNTTFGTS
jgi:hypothetical protein